MLQRIKKWGTKPMSATAVYVLLLGFSMLFIMSVLFFGGSFSALWIIELFTLPLMFLGKKRVTWTAFRSLFNIPQRLAAGRDARGLFWLFTVGCIFSYASVVSFMALPAVAVLTWFNDTLLQGMALFVVITLLIGAGLFLLRDLLLPGDEQI